MMPNDEDIFAEETEEERNAIIRDTKVTDDDVRRAIDLVARTNRASTSHFQRYLGCSYPHAVAIQDRLVVLGAIAPQEGMGPRRIVWTQDRLMKYLEGGN